VLVRQQPRDQAHNAKARDAVQGEDSPCTAPGQRLGTARVKGSLRRACGAPLTRGDVDVMPA